MLLASPDTRLGTTRNTRKDTAMTIFSNAQSQLFAAALAIVCSSFFVAVSVVPGTIV